MGRASQGVLASELARRVVHGGEHSRGRRKLYRPISSVHAMHITLRSSLAKGQWSFLHARHRSYLREFIPKLARLFGVRLYSFSNNGNHIHLLARAYSRGALKRFLMALTGRIAQRITGARKGKPLGKKFFDYIPFSRIVSWGRDFRAVKSYVLQNELEALGVIPYQPRRSRATPLPGS